MNFRGKYDNKATYQKGDIVRERDGAYNGVWISDSDTPMTGIDPAYPEPPGTWLLMSFSVPAPLKT